VNRPPERAYLVPGAGGQGEVREKGSRFLALVLPVRGEDEAAAAREEIRRRYPEATHYCWACRLGPEAAERSSDAGEPPGTAGPPILRTLRGADLSDVLCVVVRWFGGTKLGKGGLARAYAAAAKEALASLPVARRVPTVELCLDLPYEKLGSVRRLLRPPQIELAGESYGDRVALRLKVQEPARDDLLEALAGLGLAAAEGPPSPEEPPAFRRMVPSDRVLQNHRSVGAGRRVGASRGKEG
jgi:uncharacterized YigZ family protein